MSSKTDKKTQEWSTSCVQRSVRIRIQEITDNLNKMRPQKGPEKVPNGSVVKREKVVRYKECRKNHAASIGGYAVDGCREFMAAGEEGSDDALKCAACGCHRSFHRREVEKDDICDSSSTSSSPK